MCSTKITLSGKLDTNEVGGLGGGGREVVITFSRLDVNRVRSPILLVVS